MPYSVNWDEAVPAGTSAAGLIWQFIQNDKIAVRERIDSLFATVTPTSISLAEADPYKAANLVMGATAVSKIIPGATSLSLRNAADSADNLILLDAGHATFRAEVTALGSFYTTRVAHVVSGASLTMDLSAGNTHLIQLSGFNITTLTLNNPRLGGYYTFIVEQSSGGNTITWPASVKWPNATAPTLTATGSRRDIISFFYDGTDFYGTVAGQNYTV